MKRTRLVKIVALLGTAIVLVMVFAFRPTKLARLQCGDGSSLTIYAATFGTNHFWRKHDSEWKSGRPCMALWGVWNGRSDKIHTFRFTLVHETVDKEWSRLDPQMEVFGAGERVGILASTTNAPGMCMRVRVFELTDDTAQRPSAEFEVKNSALISERSKGRSKLRARLNFSRHLRLGPDLLIANARTSNEILVERAFHLGPIIVYRKFD